MSWDLFWEDLNSISGKSRFVSNLNSSACLDSKDAKSSVLNVSDTRVFTNDHSSRVQVQQVKLNLLLIRRITNPMTLPCIHPGLQGLKCLKQGTT